MFDLVYQVMFGVMVIEMIIFLFLNLPFPKTWKHGFFDNLTTSSFFKNAFKIQVVLCLVVIFLYVDLSRTESLYLRDKKRMKDKTNMGAGTLFPMKKSVKKDYLTK